MSCAGHNRFQLALNGWKKSITPKKFNQRTTQHFSPGVFEEGQQLLGNSQQEMQEEIQDRRHGRIRKRVNMRRYVKRSVWRKGRGNGRDAWKETMLGTCIETQPWKQVLCAGRGIPLRNCIFWVTCAGAGTPLKGLWPKGSPCQSRGAVRTKE